MEVLRAVFARNRQASIMGVTQGTVMRLEDVTVRDTMLPDCAMTTCADHATAVAVGAYAGATVDVRSFLVDGSVLCGIQVADVGGGAGELDLHDGDVEGCDIGACVQVDGYDLDRLLDGVTFRNKRINSQQTSLPVPQPKTDL